MKPCSAPSALLAPGTLKSLGPYGEKSWDKALGNTQLDPGTKLNPDLPLSLEWEVLQHDQFMTHAAAIAEENML